MQGQSGIAGGSCRLPSGAPLRSAGTPTLPQVPRKAIQERKEKTPQPVAAPLAGASVLCRAPLARIGSPEHRGPPRQVAGAHVRACPWPAQKQAVTTVHPSSEQWTQPGCERQTEALVTGRYLEGVRPPPQLCTGIAHTKGRLNTLGKLQSYRTRSREGARTVGQAHVCKQTHTCGNREPASPG